jgi:outer membrane protein TolC
MGPAQQRIPRRVAYVVLPLFTCILAVGQQSGPQRLSLKDAIGLALKNNLNVVIAGTQVGEASGTKERTRSALLPHVSDVVVVNRQNRNLQVAGISFPGVPTVVGPFSFYDFRVAASQSVFDRHAYHTWKAAVQQEKAAALNYQDVRDLIVRSAAALYLNSEFDAAEVQAAQSRVETSETLEKLARDRRAQELATGVDVLRAQVQLARDRQSLLVAQNTFQISLLDLARFLGLPPGVPLELTEQLRFQPIDAPDVQAALPATLQARADYRALTAQRAALLQQEKASRARYFPRLLIGGDYGAIGRNFGTMPAIGEIQATLSITVFDHDGKGEVLELESRTQRVDAQINDLAREIEEELQKAALNLQSTAQQVKLTESAIDLAKKELDLSQDRFRNGVGDNVEVITAQDALSRSQDDLLGALARHADARMALVRALGGGEKNYQSYLQGNESPGSKQ